MYHLNLRIFMSITNLKNINSEELKILLEKNGIEIKKTSNKN